MQKRSRRAKSQGKSIPTNSSEQSARQCSIAIDELTGGVLGLAAQVILPLAVLAIVLMADLSLGQAGGNSGMRGGPSSQGAAGSVGRIAR